MSGGRKWYVVHTHARSEALAAAHLERQGFETYCPRYLKRRNHARRVVNEPAPFFPRYIFVAMDVASQRWRAVRSTFGVSHLVGSEKGPTPVTDTIVEELRAHENAGGFIPMETDQGFRRGDRIKLRDGIFSSCTGLFDSVSDSGRVAVLLDILGRKVRIVLSGAAITAA
ncbi:MAG TPA: transcriptional activator RfaH [Rhizomicrobium sp.]|nr:transcriptional activator RfaH [Rhizomicrobium sp.]